MMNRRDAIAGSAGALLGVPLRSPAQTVGKVWRVGVFDFAPISEQHPNALAFFDELRRRGYVRGENLVVERRDAGSLPDRLPAIARELVAWKPDLVTVSGGAPNLAMKAATSSIPIVMTGVADPVSIGLAASLARPGGNITGMTPIVPGGFGGKMLQLLHEAVPGAKRIALFLDPNNASHVQSQGELDPSAERLGLVVRTVEVRKGARADDPASAAAAYRRSDSMSAV